jgi:hypothetical protein
VYLLKEDGTRCENKDDIIGMARDFYVHLGAVWFLVFSPSTVYCVNGLHYFVFGWTGRLQITVFDAAK